MDIFSRYAPFIQDFIYENGWESLRAVQAAAGDVIFNTDKNVLICATTASGKTEAAFFPILTMLYEDPPSSIGALYVAPLKALINDQFDRLNDLCREGEIPVWHWHGDVSQSHKRKLLKHSSGILQITPESLEAMLLHRHAAIPKLFGDLRFVVIDEIHSLMRGDRGGQTICLIERLSRLAGVDPRRIGLSATIGDPESAGRFLAAGTKRGTVVPRIEEKGQVWRLSMEHFFTTGPQASDPAYRDSYTDSGKQGGADRNSLGSGAHDKDAVDALVVPSIKVDEGERGEGGDDGPLPVLSPATDEAPVAADPGMGYIFEHSRGRKCLVFCNSREEAEAVTTTLRQYCEAQGEPDRFLIHHGNLSASIRQSAEEDMKDEDTALTTVTTATLELGIDIGRLERAFQINAPFTVSSFIQRMGRTGRRGMPPEMWFVMREEPPVPRAMMPDSIPWELIQGIALVQLYLEERWVETARPDRLPYSLLYHQTMSTLASGGEMTPAQLASRVLTLSVFHLVSQDDYRVLLNHLIEIDHIELTERGGLIVGIAGERVVNNFKFYAVFQDNEEYTVRSESQEIGTLVAPPPAGERIAIAGHVWVVEEVDRKRHTVYCTMVKGKVPAYFGDVAGDINTKILERMLGILREAPDKTYPYLMKNASARLMKARHTAGAAGVTERPLRCLGGNMWVLFPWLGSYAFLALERFLRLICGTELGIKGFDPRRPYYMIFTMKVSEQDFYRIITEKAREGVDPMELLYPKEVPTFDKYDEYLPDELVRKGFACGVLEVQEMLDRVLQWEPFAEGSGTGTDDGQLTASAPQSLDGRSH
ncbi:MAG: DEAD/DEAH box helicase [Anaerovoracaceae bacterium]|nr:DEAD/DEAH box helicase [Bacillota bacterium]MDY2670967.1 DEAD/DEAH box helicase [Anaerovoracaceae bacterium]